MSHIGKQARKGQQPPASHTVAVIIPSLRGAPPALLASFPRQTLVPDEIEVVVNVRPNGQARNVGVARTEADTLVFIDDDAVPGDEHVIEELVSALWQDESIGVIGAAKLIPPDSGWFQRWTAREVPRIEHPVVSEALETNPDPPYYYCEITTTCCAMRRDVFDEVGGFSSTLLRGVDTEFFVRVRRRGYRLMLAGGIWTWHPAPRTLRALLRKQFLYGIGHAQEVAHDPQRAVGLQRHPWLYLLLRSVALVPNVFLSYSYAAPQARLGFRPLRAIASYVSALGYVWQRVRGHTMPRED